MPYHSGWKYLNYHRSISINGPHAKFQSPSFKTAIDVKVFHTDTEGQTTFEVRFFSKFQTLCCCNKLMKSLEKQKVVPEAAERSPPMPEDDSWPPVRVARLWGDSVEAEPVEELLKFICNLLWVVCWGWANCWLVLRPANSASAASSNSLRGLAVIKPLLLVNEVMGSP